MGKGGGERLRGERPPARRPGPRTHVPAPAVALAALIIAACAGAAVWGVLEAISSSHRASRRDDVRTALATARSLVAQRAEAAVAEAARVASSPVVQDAYARRDAKALAQVARTNPRLTFELWNGRKLGRPLVSGLNAGVGVFGVEGVLGRVDVAAEPDSGLLAEARGNDNDVQLFYRLGDGFRAAAPAADGPRAAGLLRHGVTESFALNDDPTQPARLFGHASAGAVAGGLLWPLLAALVAGLVSLWAFVRRESARAPQPPPRHVRDAVALVGETLAATHNPDALLPVILQASVEATDAVGGRITSTGRVVVSRGEPDPGGETLHLDLELGDSTPAEMTLYAPPGGFGPDAQDAAEWIAGQALIALENARLHGLVQRQAVTDELTGLPNRRQFLARLDSEIARSRRSGSPLALVLADIDDFKRVNDTWGHADGDEALRSFSTILRATVRDVDLPVRLGGEEFAVLLPDTDLTGATQLAERVRQALAGTAVETARARFTMTASFGVSCFPEAAASDDLLTDADRRLYDAKRQGKNRVVTAVAVRPAQFS